MPTLVDFEEIGIIPRPKRDNRPAKKVFVDRATGLLVVDKDKYRVWLEEQKRLEQATALSYPIAEKQEPTQEISELAGKLRTTALGNLNRSKPPFVKAQPKIVVFSRRATLS